MDQTIKYLQLFARPLGRLSPSAITDKQIEYLFEKTRLKCIITQILTNISLPYLGLKVFRQKIKGYKHF